MTVIHINNYAVCLPRKHIKVGTKMTILLFPLTANSDS